VIFIDQQPSLWARRLGCSSTFINGFPFSLLSAELQLGLLHFAVGFSAGLPWSRRRSQFGVRASRIGHFRPDFQPTGDFRLLLCTPGMRSAHPFGSRRSQFGSNPPHCLQPQPSSAPGPARLASGVSGNPAIGSFSQQVTFWGVCRPPIAIMLATLSRPRTSRAPRKSQKISVRCQGIQNRSFPARFPTNR
jgi:hypothetical protein